MKRKVYVAAGVLALTLAVVVTAQLMAQTGSTAARPSTPTTKIALINLNMVVNNYDKFKTFKEEAKVAIDPFQKKDAAYKSEGEKLAKDLQDPKTSAEARDKIERRLKELQRAVEDNKVEAQKSLGKRQEDQLRILYMDVYTVVSRYAQAHGYEMVLHFNEPTNRDEYWSAQNIARKMQAGALMPIYYMGALDISNNIVSTLNASMKNAPATPASGTATPGKQ